jgi:hypothetical protein
MRTLIFVDCEAYGGAPSVGQLTEFGAVEFNSRNWFHGKIVESTPDPSNPAIPLPTGPADPAHEAEVFEGFERWIKKVSNGQQPTFVSDNNGYDWQWINDGFWRTLGYNPFGFSSRRISDFWAGLNRDFSNTQKWKSLRKTVHDHNPVNDAMGNVEAFSTILEQIRQGRFR